MENTPPPIPGSEPLPPGGDRCANALHLFCGAWFLMIHYPILWFLMEFRRTSLDTLVFVFLFSLGAWGIFVFREYRGRPFLCVLQWLTAFVPPLCPVVLAVAALRRRGYASCALSCLSLLLWAALGMAVFRP